MQASQKIEHRRDKHEYEGVEVNLSRKKEEKQGDISSHTSEEMHKLQAQFSYFVMSPKWYSRKSSGLITEFPPICRLLGCAFLGENPTVFNVFIACYVRMSFLTYLTTTCFQKIAMLTNGGPQRKQLKLARELKSSNKVYFKNVQRYL